MKRFMSIVSVIGLGSGAIGMEEFCSDNNNVQEMAVGDHTLDSQIAEVQKYIKDNKITNPKLALGVSPDEKDFEKRLDASWVCITQGPSHHLTHRMMAFDLNDLPGLENVAKTFPKTFSTIVMDNHVFKFMYHWNKKHLLLLRDMLKDGGTLHIPLMFLLRSHEIEGQVTQDMHKELAEKEIQKQTHAGQFLGPIICITGGYTPNDASVKKVQDLTEKFKLAVLPLLQDKDKNDKEIDEELVKLGLDDYDSLKDVSEESYADRIYNIYHSSILPDLTSFFLRDKLWNENYLPIFKQAFGEDNVLYAATGELPFFTLQGTNQTESLVISTKKD